jgi:hypothetical protein
VFVCRHRARTAHDLYDAKRRAPQRWAEQRTA